MNRLYVELCSCCKHVHNKEALVEVSHYRDPVFTTSFEEYTLYDNRPIRTSIRLNCQHNYRRFQQYAWGD